jgi:hypothetical protein
LPGKSLCGDALLLREFFQVTEALLSHLKPDILRSGCIIFAPDNLNAVCPLYLFNCSHHRFGAPPPVFTLLYFLRGPGRLSKGGYGDFMPSRTPKRKGFYLLTRRVQ